MALSASSISLVIPKSLLPRWFHSFSLSMVSKKSQQSKSHFQSTQNGNERIFSSMIVGARSPYIRDRTQISTRRCRIGCPAENRKFYFWLELRLWGNLTPNSAKIALVSLLHQNYIKKVSKNPKNPARTPYCRILLGFKKRQKKMSLLRISVTSQVLPGPVKLNISAVTRNRPNRAL